MNGAGSVQDGAGIAIAAGTSGEVLPALAAGPGTKFGVAYERFAVEAPYGAHRVFLRTVAPK